jgi:hypothetical protein
MSLNCGHQRAYCSSSIHYDTCPTDNTKLKLSHYTPWRLLRERRYSSYSLSTMALDGGEWSASRPGLALPPGKGPMVPIVQEAGWAPNPVWTQRLEEKFFRFCRESNLDRPVVQTVARHYTDWATRLTQIIQLHILGPNFQITFSYCQDAKSKHRL